MVQIEESWEECICVVVVKIKVMGVIMKNSSWLDQKLEDIDAEQKSEMLNFTLLWSLSVYMDSYHHMHSQ